MYANHGWFEGDFNPALLGFDEDIKQYCRRKGGGTFCNVWSQPGSCASCDAAGFSILNMFGHIPYNSCRNCARTAPSMSLKPMLTTRAPPRIRQSSGKCARYGAACRVRATCASGLRSHPLSSTLILTMGSSASAAATRAAGATCLGLALQHGQIALLAVPESGSYASLGRARRL